MKLTIIIIWAHLELAVERLDQIIDYWIGGMNRIPIGLLAMTSFFMLLTNMFCFIVILSSDAGIILKIISWVICPPILAVIYMIFDNSSERFSLNMCADMDKWNL